VTEEPRHQSAAAAAAEKVRAIVDAAERSAAELEAAAREDAARIRAQAEREADARLAGARQTAGRLAERAAALERQVAQIRASLAELVGDLEQLRGADAGVPEKPAEGEAGEPAPLPRDEAGTRHHAAGAGGSPAEGARVIALNMALNGTPREQTARYLAENFELDDPDALLEEVYARVGGGPAGAG
jgi:hypothetical protein